MRDEVDKALVYLVIGRKLIEGARANSLSATARNADHTVPLDIVRVAYSLFRHALGGRMAAEDMVYSCITCRCLHGSARRSLGIRPGRNAITDHLRG